MVCLQRREMFFTGKVRQWKVPELQPGQIDPIMASYAYLGREETGQPQIQS